MPATASNPLLYLSAKMWQYAKGNRRNVVFYVTLFVFANAVAAIEPFIIGLILNFVQLQGIHPSNLSHLFWLLGIFPLSSLIFWAFHGPARIIENKNAFFVRANYKQYLLKGIMALPIEWHTDHHSGETIDKIEKGTIALSDFASRTFEILEASIALFVAFGVLLFYDRLAGAIVIAMTIPTFYILLGFDRKLVPGYKRVNSIENSITAKIFDVLSNITTVIILRVESLVFNSIRNFIEKPFPQYRINIKLNEQKWFSAAILGRLAVVIAIGVYASSHAVSGVILVGTIYILYGYANQIRETFFRFASLYNDIVRYRAAVANSEELSADFVNSDLSGSRGLPANWKEIEIKNLSFSYHSHEGADLHLDDVAIKFFKGERIALIGESGGGKSTFLKIARDLYHPKRVDFLLDGKNIPKGFAAIKDAISLVPQDPEIFSTTIRENITLGVDYTDEHIKIFTEMASFSNVVGRLPKGLESSVVEKGVNLSGGEKQRLALARGLLASADKEIVLLDEPTSSVDFKNELEIYANIFNAFPQKTIISSIHRLHLLSLFNSVYFFKDGKIIASGTFEDLKKHSPDFQVLWGKYIATRDAG